MGHGLTFGCSSLQVGLRRVSVLRWTRCSASEEPDSSGRAVAYARYSTTLELRSLGVYLKISSLAGAKVSNNGIVTFLFIINKID